MKAFWQAQNGRGDVCGHHHRRFVAAVRCARSLDRQSRMRRARYGGEREDWLTEHVEPGGKTLA